MAGRRREGERVVTPPPFLTIDGVSKRFGEVRVLERVSLDIARGEFLTLLGPSGSGKSTLLGVLAGFSAPDQGCVCLDGADITHLPPEARRFGVVPQGYGLFPHLTVYENVAFPLRVRGVSNAGIVRRVGDVLELLQIGGLGGRRPKQLSGGQQQRAALARALAFEPKLLLLDEPMSALDASLRRDLQGELVRLHREVGTTFVYVTHDQEEALALSDRIAVLNRGRVEQLGPPRAIYDHPASRFVASFLGKNNLLKAVAAGAIDGRPQFHWNGYRIAAGAGASVSAEVAGAAFVGPCVLTIRPENIAVVPAGQARPGLEEQIQGTVVSQTYHGASVDIVVAVGQETLTVTRPAADWSGAPGEDISLAFDAERLWRLPGDGMVAVGAPAVVRELVA